MGRGGQKMSKKRGISLEMIDRILLKQEQQEKVAEGNTVVAKRWLEISKEDMETTKILYGKGHFAFAVYHLQQAFEKLAKGYYLLTGRITPEQAKDHRFVLDRLKKEFKEEDMKNIFELISTLNKKTFDLTNSESALSILEKSEDDLRMASKEDLTKIISSMELYENNLKSRDTLNILEAKINKPSLFRLIKYLLSHYSIFRIRDSEVREAISEYNLKEYISYLLLSTRLHYLCVLTFSHFNTPRYPYIPNSKVNFYSYNTKLGIVSIMPQFISLFDEIFDAISSKIIEQKSKNPEIQQNKENEVKN